MVIQTNLKCELQKAVRVQYLNGNLFSQDNQGNQINVEVFDGGSPATLSGTVSANVIRADGGTVAVSSGSFSGNVASVTLPSAAYAVPGVVSIIIKITSSGVITTLAAIVANVYQSSTDTAVDPGTIIPSIQTLISSIETAVASIPADYSSLWTSLAPAFNSSNNYTAGQYVTYSGVVYTFKVNHSGSWSASDVVAVDIGGQLSQLKSAIDLVDNTLGKINIGNLVLSPVSGKVYRYNGNGVIYEQDAATYMCVKIDVTGMTHVTATRNFSSSNFQFFGTDSAFVETAANCRTSDAGYVFAVPTGANRFYVSLELSTWNAAICKGKDEISNKTITDFPVGGTWILDGYNTEKKKIDDIYPLVNNTTTRNVQYIDNSLKETGYYYNNDTKVPNESYSVFPPVTVPAGTYYLASLSTNFSYVKIGNTFTKLSSLNPPTLIQYQNIVVSVNSEATFYLSKANTSTYKTILSTIPMKPDDAEYRLGEFLPCPNKTIYVGSTRQYKTLKSALEAVSDVFDAYVYVDAETFDLVDEFGTTYLNNYSTAESFGLFLKNRVHLIFASGAKVAFNYTGSNAYVHEWFAPFNAGRYGFELVNADIDSKNCRYSVHDEHGTDYEPYRNVYKNCKMKHDSSSTTWGAHQCIGGGLGRHGTIEIDGCCFNAVDSTVDASYHNSSTSDNTHSNIFVRDCYFEHTFRASTYGTGTEKSEVYVCGNSVSAEPFVSQNDGAADNVTMKKWGNVIRT